MKKVNPTTLTLEDRKTLINLNPTLVIYINNSLWVELFFTEEKIEKEIDIQRKNISIKMKYDALRGPHRERVPWSKSTVPFDSPSHTFSL